MSFESKPSESPEVAERKQKLDMLGDLEAMNSPDALIGAWSDVTQILTDSLTHGDKEEHKEAEAVLGSIYQTLLEASATQPELKKQLTELDHLFERAASIKQYTEHLLSLDDRGLRETFSQMEAISTTPQQQRCIDSLLLMQKLGDSILTAAANKNPDRDPPIVGKLNELLPKIGPALGKAFESSDPQPGDLVPDELMNIFRYPQMYFGAEVVTASAAFSNFVGGGENFPSIDFRTINSEAEFNSLKASVARAMGAVGGYLDAALMVTSTIPDDVLLKAKEAVKTQVEQRVNGLRTETYMKIYGQSRDRVKTDPDILRRELNDSANLASEMARGGIEAQMVLEYLGDQGYQAPDKEMWEAAQDIFDVNDEWFETSAANMDLVLEASIQIALVSASIVLPELVAAGVMVEVALLSDMAVQILRLNKLTKYSQQAYRIMRASGLSQRAARTITILSRMPGKIGQISTHLLISGGISEVSAQSLIAIAENDPTWGNTLDADPLAFNIVVNAAVSGLFSVPLSRGVWPPSFGVEFAANSISRAIIPILRPLFKAGFRPVCAAIVATQIKAGEITGEEAREYMTLLGEELYNLAQCDNLTSFGS